MKTPFEITWSDALAVWWSFFWRSTLLGFLLGGLFGFILGALGLASAAPFGAVVGMIAGVPAGMIAMKLTLEAQMLRLAEMSRDVPDESRALADRLYPHRETRDNAN